MDQNVKQYSYTQHGVVEQYIIPLTIACSYDRSNIYYIQ